ncbi:glucokinase [Stappia stellulata]|uniref:glucokinase n=1 Tax=Stappia stellulata TaxID=71235 RepID=UPI001CD54F40|nr:glucokinase [Stappia stellulata]MCA1244549.1 glucokinase [Stappia stellulata]
MTASPIPHAAFPFPVLVADIGGTNARFALVAAADAPTGAAARVPTADHAGFFEAARAALPLEGATRPRSAVLAVAGPVTGERIPLTNADWVIEPRKLMAELDLDRVLVLNDFEAQALALPGLDGDHLQQIGPGTRIAQAPQVVLGPGTGLGAAAMIHAAGRWVPVPGEGGHVELGPVSAEDYRVWPHIERVGGRIGAEQIISGSGLLRLARAVCAAEGATRDFSAPGDVTSAADAGDEIANRTLALFAHALGRVAGDFALTFLARGGVFLGGGIPPRIERHLVDGGYRAAFEAKVPHDALMATIPTFLVRHDAPALEGLADFARTPDRFAVDLDGRMWTRAAADRPK